MRVSLFFGLFVLLSFAACEDAPVDAPALEARRVEVEVGSRGYTPANVEATAGQPLSLVFRRTTDEGCGEELVFPDHDIRRDLPLNEDVVVELTPQTGEAIRFTCGMDMYRGSVVAR